MLLEIASMLAEPAGAQTRKEKEAAIKTYIENQLTDRQFKIAVSMAYPMRGSSIPLTSSYTLEMKQDSVDVYLPYYGRAYSVPYGGGNGLKFQSTVTDFSMKKKKGRYEIKFSSRTDEDIYDFYIDIGSEGNASVSVTMRNRQPIRFYGTVNTEAMEEETEH